MSTRNEAAGSQSAASKQSPLHILIVENDEDDAENLTETLKDGLTDAFNVETVNCVGAAVAALRETAFDVVLLDLNLPDSQGSATVSNLRSSATEAAFIVVSGNNEDSTVRACFQAGAQDFLYKAELNGTLLSRSVGYGLFRVRDRQLAELEQSLDHYRALSSSGSTTQLADQMTGGGPISERMPQQFAAMCEDYRRVLRKYMRFLAIYKDKPQEDMDRLATRLGDHGAGPRDLMDMHVKVIDESLQHATGANARSVITESRLVALELMGILVNYYRIGTRRR